jgi:hypothetical protein
MKILNLKKRKIRETTDSNFMNINGTKTVDYFHKTLGKLFMIIVA